MRNTHTHLYLGTHTDAQTRITLAHTNRHEHASTYQ
jgi:hypothetical protein